MRRAAAGRTVVAHLGNGASLCALQNGRSVATTMGFTAIDGLMMGTRCGTIDPGVLLYLLDRHGLAGPTSSGCCTRIGAAACRESPATCARCSRAGDPRAAEAVGLFVYRIGRELGSLAAALGGLDALVFTGGIGENAPIVRERICAGARWLGVRLDDEANATNGPRISRAESAVSVWVVPTDEELMIAQHTRRVLASMLRRASSH